MSLNKYILKFACQIHFLSMQFTDSVIEHWICMCWTVCMISVW